MAQPNILFLMIDGAQGRLFEPGSPARTPNFSRLAAGGVRIARATTVNPICSPARASLMTGLLPHNHGVLDVIHSVPDDQCCLRRDRPHWAARLTQAGYRTGYFGKWHVERSHDLAEFGWQVNGETDREYYRARDQITDGGEKRYDPSCQLAVPAGYKPNLLYGADSAPIAARLPGQTVATADNFLHEVLDGDRPWCCFVSLSEPNEPPICGRGALDSYAIDGIQLPATEEDDLAGRPGLYAKSGGLWNSLAVRQKKELLACQYAAITEIDALYGRLLARIDHSRQADNTIVIFTSDHGNLLGAHGLLAHNVSGFEENYHIPMILRGPGIAQGEVSTGRVSLADVGSTLLELCGLPPMDTPDSRSFAPLLSDPRGAAGRFTTAYAEYFGARYHLDQRVLWDGDWKLVFNGFDHDEMYDLKSDPQELHNLARLPAHRARLESMMGQIWARVRDTGDKTLYESHWPGVRWAVVGPLFAQP